MPSFVKTVLLGALKAAVGSYLGALLLIIVAASLTGAPTAENPRDVVSWRSFIELVTVAATGVIALSWWILPVGAVFETVVKPRIVRATRLTATVRGAFIGLGLGLLTAWIFALTPGSEIPRKTLLIAFAFVPIYCSVWCGLYSRANASGSHSSSGPS
jgi:hypothetical protein